MFLKDSKPWTRRRNVWFAVYCAACLTFAVGLFGYNVWAESNITKSLSYDVDVRRASIIVLRCSAHHFWVHHIYYRDDDSGGPGDIYLHTGRACYDWRTGEWELTQDSDWQ